MKGMMEQQLAEFDEMKKKLMKDLQQRCERVVELEMSLNKNQSTGGNSKVQQQKMAFLERNLEQLSNVQKQVFRSYTS
jgi:kinesin family protein 5